MVAIVIGALLLVALTAWAAAAFSALSIVTLAPRGSKLKSYFQLGLCRFATLEAALGARAVPHLRRYRTALISFMTCVIAGAAVSILLAGERLN